MICRGCLWLLLAGNFHLPSSWIEDPVVIPFDSIVNDVTSLPCNLQEQIKTVMLFKLTKEPQNEITRNWKVVGRRMKKFWLEVCCCGFGQISPTVGVTHRPKSGILNGNGSTYWQPRMASSKTVIKLVEDITPKPNSTYPRYSRLWSYAIGMSFIYHLLLILTAYHRRLKCHEV